MTNLAKGVNAHIGDGSASIGGLTGCMEATEYGV